MHRIFASEFCKILLVSVKYIINLTELEGNPLAQIFIIHHINHYF